LPPDDLDEVLEQTVMKEIKRNGLRFPLEDDNYEIPPELGKELMQLNQEMIDAKNRQTLEISSETDRTGEQLS
jgi:hypothetical protein